MTEREHLVFSFWKAAGCRQLVSTVTRTAQPPHRKPQQEQTKVATNRTDSGATIGAALADAPDGSSFENGERQIRGYWRCPGASDWRIKLIDWNR